MKVALLGGSFNPIHNGHLEIANKILKNGVVDEVWLIPCGNHPFEKNLIEGQERIRMIRKAIGNNNRIKAIDIELISSNISYTSDTVKLMKDKFREVDFYFVIGSDNLINLQKWHNFEYLKKNVEFILVKRPGFELINNFGIKIIYTLEMENKTSSTEIRKSIAGGKSIAGLVPQEVAEYITEEGIYHG